MLVCATCGSRWDEDARLAAMLPAALCPMCEGVLVELDEAQVGDGVRVHADVARVLRGHLLGVGA